MSPMPHWLPQSVCCLLPWDKDIEILVAILNSLSDSLCDLSLWTSLFRTPYDITKIIHINCQTKYYVAIGEQYTVHCIISILAPMYMWGVGVCVQYHCSVSADAKILYVWIIKQSKLTKLCLQFLLLSLVFIKRSIICMHVRRN